MYYAELEPLPELKPWVAAYWHFCVRPEVDEIEHWIPLTGGALVSFPQGKPAGISGPRVTPLHLPVRGGESFWGFHLWPGACSLLGPEVGRLREQIVPLSSIADPAWTESLSEALLEVDDPGSACRAFDQALTSLRHDTLALDDQVMTAVFRIIATNGHCRLDELARGVGLSPRQLRRRFRAAVELTAKELARLRRMRTSAVDAVQRQTAGWVEIAADRGYADQAHLVREFRDLIGLTPTEFGSHVARIRHGEIFS